MEKSIAIFVKVENESNNIEIVKYNRPSVASTSANVSNDTVSRLMSELADIRQKYSDGIYELEKTKEIVVTLNNEKQRLHRTIGSNKKTISSLTNLNKKFESQIAEAEKKMNGWYRENAGWKDQKSQLESSIASLREEKLSVIENTKSKHEENERLRKELKALQARVQQNLSGTLHNKQYFSQTPTKVSQTPTINSYEVKQLLSHRKKIRSSNLKFSGKIHG